MTHRNPIRTIVVAAVAVLSLAVGLASYTQRSASRTGAEQSRTAQELLTAMLDQETGLRGFGLSRDDDFLEPYGNGRADYAEAYAAARRQVRGDARALRTLEASDGVADAWAAAGDDMLTTMLKRRHAKVDVGAMRARKALMDRYRELNRNYAALMRDRAEHLETRAVYLSVLVVALLGAAFALAGAIAGRRRNALLHARMERERSFAARQRDLNLGLQVTESEEEAQGFLHRHLERSIPDSEVVILKRNNSANRLLPGTPLAEGSKLTGAFGATEPRSCLAIRLAQPRANGGADSDSVLRCDICGKLETQTTCSPLLVGGEVIGSVLVGHPAPLDDDGEKVIDEAVKQAAPVLANLRNLAIAETRAATDGLTGLPNRRSFEESLRRTVAHSARALTPLAAVALDLDHFKAINDTHGHAVGDEVLASVGALLTGLLRGTDVAARVGGEEFMILLPDTSRDGALVICERIRAAIGALELPLIGRQVTASLGVAILPDDASDATALVRAADRMLYAAKANGRNRVEITDLLLGPLPDGEATAAPS
ncbi:MAG TPA: diguanylate cyclase [Solirubrobacteraceae bacterium]|jgi:diguanylate cyclase (GGDEF)-like protein